MAMECGEDLKETATLVNGIILKRMGMGHTFGPTVIDMKDNGIIVSNMVEELIFLLIEIHMLVSINTENLMDRGPILGQMEAPMLEVSKME